MLVIVPAELVGCTDRSLTKTPFFPGFFFLLFFIYCTYWFLEAVPQLFDDWFLKSKSEALLSSPQLQNFVSTVCPL